MGLLSSPNICKVIKLHVDKYLHLILLSRVLLSSKLGNAILANQVLEIILSKHLVLYKLLLLIFLHILCLNQTPAMSESTLRLHWVNL